ncbi:MAG: transposase zinc-binding domain-containing protein [Verrucomicrobiota bacterium]|nr:transposase zinc-binding domain-containing protein [Verrucomicrobiota bacterium]
MVEQVYRPRRPNASPLWQCLFGHFDAFLELYEEQYQPRYGFLRPIIPEVVNKFLDCGDLEHGFARVRCDDCKHEYLLAFPRKGRWFCPCCHQKKVQIFGALLSEAVLFPVARGPCRGQGNRTSVLTSSGRCRWYGGNSVTAAGCAPARPARRQG